MVLRANRQRERNRRQSGVKNHEVLKAIDAHIAFIDAQIEALEQRIHDHIDQDPRLSRDNALLKTIPGIGDTTAAVFLAEVGDISRFDQAPGLAAFAGLAPGQRYSSTSTRSQGHIVKWGNKYLRATLFMPAMTAHRWNPLIAALKEQLAERGKSKVTIIVAAMRKLLHLCYGVLKTGKSFDHNHAVNVPTST
jgi:transposase